jgi:hypothetical protein
MATIKEMYDYLQPTLEHDDHSSTILGPRILTEILSQSTHTAMRDQADRHGLPG